MFLYFKTIFTLTYFYRMSRLITDHNKIAFTTMKQPASQVKDITVAAECTNARHQQH